MARIHSVSLDIGPDLAAFSSGRNFEWKLHQTNAVSCRGLRFISIFESSASAHEVNIDERIKFLLHCLKAIKVVMERFESRL